MIKAKATLKGDRPLYLFGIAADNVARLKQGQPITISLEEMGGVGEVLIVYGDNLADVLREFGAFIGPDTIMHATTPGDAH